jgi:biotin operon repressor
MERRLGISRKAVKQAATALVENGWYFDLPITKQVRINSYQIRKAVKLCRQDADALRAKIDPLGIGDLA